MKQRFIKQQRRRGVKYTDGTYVSGPGKIPVIDPYYPLDPYDLKTGKSFPRDPATGLMLHPYTGMLIDDYSWLLFDPKWPGVFYDIETLERVDPMTGRVVGSTSYSPEMKKWNVTATRTFESWNVQFQCPVCHSGWLIHVALSETSAELYCFNDGSRLTIPLPLTS